MNVKELLKKCQRDRTAVLATNFYNFETLTAVMQAAQRMQAPVLLQLTRSSINYMGLEQAVGMGRRAIADYGVEGWIHLDHGGSVELVERCLDAGFDSVMIDASERPFDENVSTTRRVVELARPYGVNVEAELGYVAKLGQAQGGGFTTPEEAARFVEATGVDALAVAIGSAHGFYKQAPRLDIERLAQIHAATDAALVLHGSSGIPTTWCAKRSPTASSRSTSPPRSRTTSCARSKAYCSKARRSTCERFSQKPWRRSWSCFAKNTAWSAAAR